MSKKLKASLHIQKHKKKLAKFKNQPDEKNSNSINQYKAYIEECEPAQIITDNMKWNSVECIIHTFLLIKKIS